LEIDWGIWHGSHRVASGVMLSGHVFVVAAIAPAMSDIIETPPPEDPFDAIVDSPFDAALSERYLIYAMSTITARSLPDLRDGLKPVHRRLLWAMRLLKLDPSQGYKKCARVVGDVIGKYHPHGDQSVYDAMVILPLPIATPKRG
jgi:topoisomerase-4 subunit A